MSTNHLQYFLKFSKSCYHFFFSTKNSVIIKMHEKWMRIQEQKPIIKQDLHMTFSILRPEIQHVSTSTNQTWIKHACVNKISGSLHVIMYQHFWQILGSRGTHIIIFCQIWRHHVGSHRIIQARKTCSTSFKNDHYKYVWIKRRNGTNWNLMLACPNTNIQAELSSKCSYDSWMKHVYEQIMKDFQSQHDSKNE